ncbi:MAG: hypothetical protein ACRDK0_15805 [Solirubrobacteraceae bacterium]
MSTSIHRGNALRMRAPPPTKPTERDADNELYDQGCDLVAAASAIRRAAGAPEAARAVPAVLGCMESALQELMWASVALEQTSVDLFEQNARDCPSSTIGPIAERMQRGFANLQQALADGERASAAARSLAARSLTASGAARPDRRRRGSTA